MVISISNLYGGESSINAVDAEVTAKLQNPRYRRAMQYGTEDNPYWDVTVCGHLNAAEKTTLTQRWVDAGWHNVSVSNSSDNGERPGLVSVKLYKFPQGE